MKWVKIDGTVFRKHSILLLSLDLGNSYPFLGQVQNIFVEKGKKKTLFHCHLIECVGFDIHYYAHEVKMSSNSVVISYDHLLLHIHSH